MTGSNFNFKTFTSFLLAWTFAALIVSGLVLYVAPPGRIANWGGWSLAGLTKESWQAIHVLVALAFLVGGLFHLLRFNWKVFLHYFKSGKYRPQHRREILVSMVLFGAILSGAVISVPPFSSIMQLSEDIKAYWEGGPQDPPVPHMELMSLADVSKQIGIGESEAFQVLANAGIRHQDGSKTLKDLALSNGKTPREIYDLLVQALPAETRPRPAISGLGRMTIAQMAVQLGMPLEELIDELGRQGVVAGPEEAFRDVAARIQMDPHQLLERVRGN